MPSQTREELILDTRQAQAAARRLEAEITKSFTNVKIDLDDTEVERLRRTVREIGGQLQFDTGDVTRLNTQLGEAARNSDSVEDNIRNLAGQLGISEAAATRMARDISIAQTNASLLEEAARDTARSMGLADKEADEFARAMARVASETREADRAASGLSGGFSSLRGSLLGLGVGVAAVAGIRAVVRGLGDALNEFIEFDRAINQSLAIVSDVTPQLRDQFESVARSIGQNLLFSATEAGEAFFFLASAGFEAQQAMKALPLVAQFAQAGMFDLSTATTLLADSQTALGLRSADPIKNLQQLTRVADVLTRANILSNAEVEQFAESLTNKAATAARLVGVEVEEVVATLAAFADRGLKGEAAGEAFAIVLRDLQRAALGQPEVFERLGIAVFDASGEFRPLADIIGEMEVALDGMSDAQARASLMALGFQDRSVANLQTLLGTSGAIRNYTIELQKAGGATEKLANNQLLSLGNRLQLARQRFDDAKISIGESLVPAVEAFVEVLPELIEQVRDLAPALVDVAQAAQDALPAIIGFFELILDFAADAPRSVGILSEIGSVLGDIFAFGGLPADFIGDLMDFTDPTPDLDATSAAIGRIGTAIDNLQFGRLEQGLVDSMKEGTDSLTALGNALVELDEGEGGVSMASIARLAKVAGVEGKNLEAVLRAVIARSKEFGLTAAEVRIYELVLRDLSTTSIEAIRQQNLLARAALELPTAVESAAARIEAVENPIEAFMAEAITLSEEAGIGFHEFVLGTSGDIQALLAALTPADQLNVILRSIASDSEQAGLMLQRTLIPGLIDAGQAMKDLNEDGRVTAEEWITNLTNMATAALNFKANLAVIAEISPEVALALKNIGPEAAGLIAEQLAADPQKILEAEAANFLGTTTGLESTISKIVAQALRIYKTDPSAVAEFTATIAQLDIPGATMAIATAIQEASDEAVTQLDDPGIPEFLEGVMASDNARIAARTAGDDIFGEFGSGITGTIDAHNALREDLRQSVLRLFDGLSASAEAEGVEIANRFERGIRGGLRMESPSRVMIEIGRLAGESLVDAFKAAVSGPVTALSGVSVGAGFGGRSAGPGVGSGPLVSLTVNGTGGDISRDAAKGAQIAGSIVSMLGLVRGPGTIVRN